MRRWWLPAAALVLSVVAVVALWLWPVKTAPWEPADSAEPGDRANPARPEAPRANEGLSGTAPAARGTAASPRPATPMPAWTGREPPTRASGGDGRPASPDVAPGAEPAPRASRDAGRRFGIDRDGIREAMREAIPDIKDCYEQWLALQSELAGTLRVTFVIQAGDAGDGEVTEVSAPDAGVGNLAFQGCVLSVVKDLRFDPPPDGTLRVAYPLHFVAADSGSP